MASILETFLILFETSAKEAEKEMVSAEVAAERLAATIDRVGKIDPTNVQAVAAGVKEAEQAANVLRDALLAAGEEGAQTLSDLTAGLEAQLAATSGRAGDLDAGLKTAGAAAGELRNELTDPVGDAAKSTKPLATGLEQAANEARKLAGETSAADKNAKELGGSFMGFARKLAGPLVAMVSVGAAVNAIRNTFGSIVELTEKASRYNFNVEGYNATNQIIEDMGGNAGDAERYIKRFSDAVSEAYGDMASAPGKVLKSLKVNAADAKGNLKDTEQVLLDVAGALEGMNRRAQIDKLRQLGIIDPAMIKLVLQGRDAVEKLMAAEKAKGIITNEGAAKVRELKAAWDDAKDAIFGVVASMLTGLTPALSAVAHGLTVTIKWLTQHKTLIQGFGIAMAVAAGIITAVFLPAIWAAAAGVIAATWPVLAIIAAVAALGAIFALVYEDVMFFLKGQPSLIGNLAAKYEWFGKLIKALGVYFEFAGKVWAAVGRGIMATLEVLAAAFGVYFRFSVGFWKVLGSIAVNVFRTIWAIAGPVVRLIMDIVGALFGIWRNHFDGMLSVARAVFGALWPAVAPVFALIMAGVESLRGFWTGALDAITGAWGVMADGIASAWSATIDAIIGGVQRAVDWIRKLLGLRSDAEAKGAKEAADAKAAAGRGGRPGGGGGEDPRAATRGAMARGRGALGAAGSTPLAAVSRPGAAGRGAVTKTNNVKVEKVVVNTQATDADGMARAAGGALTGQLKKTAAQFDDGVDR